MLSFSPYYKAPMQIEIETSAKKAKVSHLTTIQI